MKETPLISICIITYKRQEQLSVLLDSLVSQSIYSQQTVEIIVVDNDVAKTAEPIIQEFIAQHPDIRLVYEIEPIQGIPLARNHSVKLAQGDFIAFIDDDEKADKVWLESLYHCISKYDADAVFGPVEPVLPVDCPDWLRKGNFYNRPHHKDGTPLMTGRTGNALVRRGWLDKFNDPFDPALRLSGGSDSDFFVRIMKQGAKLRWAEKAIVYEFVGPERLKLKWLVMRAFRGGQGYARKRVAERNIIGKIMHVLYRLALVCFSMFMSVVLLPFGKHQSVWWLRKVFSNAGQISVLLPFRYEEYKPSNYR